MILSNKLKKLINIKRVFREPALLFTASRYLGYAMVMVRGILLAKYLGPALFGTWGFLTLMEQYLSYSNFGLQYAVTVKLATQDAESRTARSRIISAAFLTSLLLTTLLAIAGVWVQIGHVELFTKYDINQYAILLVLWVSLVNLQHVLINIYRVYNQLLRIAISELLTAFVPLVVVFLFREESLITASLAAMAGSCLLSILIFLYKPPFEWTVKFSKDIVWGLFGVGVPLLIYNLSYNMITMVGRTILSAYYSKEQMGYYSFASSITSATLLGFRAILWLAFPMVLYRTRDEVASQEAVKTVRKVNDLFNTSVFLSVFAVIIASPLFYLLLPQYKSEDKILAILLLTQAMLLISWGWNSMAIARKRQNQVALISVAATVCVTLIGLWVSSMKMPAPWVATAVCVGSFIYTLLQIYLGHRVIQPDGGFWKFFATVLPFGSIIAVVVAYIGIMLGFTFWSTSLALLIYIFANRGKIQMLWRYAHKKFG